MLTKNNLTSIWTKGAIFAILLMLIFSSCCVTGYCQVDTEEAKQTLEKTDKK